MSVWPRPSGAITADAFYVGFIRAYAVNVMRLEPDGFDGPMTPRLAKSHYEDEMEEAFPQDPAHPAQRSAAQHGARMGRHQRAALAAGAGRAARCRARPCGAAHGARAGQRVFSGAGVVQFISSDTGAPQVTGRYLPQGQGRAALSRSEAMFIETGCPRPRAGG